MTTTKTRVGRALGAWGVAAAMALAAFAPGAAADLSFEWATAMGGTDRDTGFGIAVDGVGNVYTMGTFQKTAAFGPFQLNSAGRQDIFVTKQAPDGSFLWARSMGGANNDQGWDIAVDSAGNVYTTGAFQGTADFDPGPDTYTLTSAGEEDIFVSKLDTDGNFLWARAFGGTGIDFGQGIAVDDAGNVYTTGFFGGTADFDPGPDAFELSAAGSYDIFVSKLDTDGNFVWARAMGGETITSAASSNNGHDIAVDKAGNVYTTGRFRGVADFDPGPDACHLTSAGWVDIFVSKLDTDGNFLWARSMGGSYFDEGWGIDLDSRGNVYTTGLFHGTADFGPFQLKAAGRWDIFVAKLDTYGNFVWAHALGWMNYDIGRSIAVDGAGNVYTTGHFNGSADFDPGPGTQNRRSAGGTDIFVSKLDTFGNFLWAQPMGGSNHDEGHAITVDRAGNVYVTGWFQGTANFDPGPGTFNLESAGLADIFVVKLSNQSKPFDLAPAIVRPPIVRTR